MSSLTPAQEAAMRARTMEPLADRGSITRALQDADAHLDRQLLLDELAAARDALRRHGKHLVWCDLADPLKPPAKPLRCTCGFDEAARAHLGGQAPQKG